MTEPLQPAPCCGAPPMLRVEPRVRAGLTIPYVRYQCGVCGCIGGLGITANEAWSFWRPGERYEQPSYTIST